MGHIRLGRIPKRGQWVAVFDALGEGTANPSEVANAVATASARRFAEYGKDPSLNFYVWTLVRVLAASRDNDFTAQLSRVGIKVPEQSSAAEFISKLSRFAEEGASKRGMNATLSSLAHRSFHAVLSNAITAQTNTLFESGLHDVQQACKRVANEEHFGAIARQFFTGFVSSAVKFVADKEVSNSVGSKGSVKSIDEIDGLHNGIDRYCRDMGKLVETFSAQWYGKHNWLTKNEISEAETSRFTAHAFKKLQMELSGVGE